MKQIKYTTGTLLNLDDTFYTLTLFNGLQQVYVGTLDRIEASNLINKSNKIQLI